MGEIPLGIIGTISSFNDGVFLSRRILNDQFLSKVMFIDCSIKSIKISAHPNGFDYVYGNIPVGGTYIFAKHQISYLLNGAV